MSLNHRWLKKPHASTEEMTALYNAGMSGTQIGEKFGMAKNSVTRRLKKAGVHIRTTSDYDGNKRYWLWKDLDRDPIERKRSSRKHRDWSRAILKRDNYSCQKCGKPGENSLHSHQLHAHHIIAIKDCINSKLEFDVENGITLCPKCHKNIHKIQRA